MTGTTLDLNNIINEDGLARQIANTYSSFNSYRGQWLGEKRELRNYIFATDTRSTSNSKLPWKNSTTLPKLCQIRDNLHANYMAALFPNDKWMLWEGDTKDADSMAKRIAIQAYMENKVEQSKFKQTVSQLVYDFIDYGNVFATTEWVEEKTTDKITGVETLGYVGPKAVRLSPPDVVFNPTAAEFSQSPKILRSLKSIGEIVRDYGDTPDPDNKKLFDYAMDRAKLVRRQFADVSAAELNKTQGFIIDGFGDMKSYYSSGLVEVLEFYGTLYDIYDEELYEDHIIVVIDRNYVLSKKTNPSWRKNSSVHHCGWRLRPDNLYAMGPLDNLVGMQYRIDHLENLKADAFDLIAFPMFKVKGYVEEFQFGPNERIYCGDDGDVQELRPDYGVLNANNDIALLEARMEEMAGAPREAMGFRTPGEKTAFEVGSLTTAGSRIFESKARYFEEMVIEPLLNDMLELARRNLPTSDLVRVMDDSLQVTTFLTITKDDLAGAGKLKPKGAAHFARNNTLIQNLTNFSNSSIGVDPAVNAHISGKRMARLFENLLGVEKFGLVEDNIRVMEQMETQQIAQAAQQQLELEAITPAGLTEGDDI